MRCLDFTEALFAPHTAAIVANLTYYNDYLQIYTVQPVAAKFLAELQVAKLEDLLQHQDSDVREAAAMVLPDLQDSGQGTMLLSRLF